MPWPTPRTKLGELSEIGPTRPPSFWSRFWLPRSPQLWLEIRPGYFVASRIVSVCCRAFTLMWSVSTIMPRFIIPRITCSPSAVRPFGLHNGAGG